MWPDNIKMRDSLGTVNPRLQDAMRISDSVGTIKPVLTDTFKLSDTRISTASSVVAQKPDAYVLRDAFTDAALTTVKYAASGTPNTDPGGDTYIDQAVPATNFGATTPILIRAETVAGVSADAQEVWVEIDFTKFANMTVKAGGVHKFNFTMKNVGLLTPTVIGTAYVFVARPFTESTLTWNNKPALPGAQGALPVFSPPADNLDHPYIWTFADADITTFLGKWLLLQLSEATAPANRALVQMPSRESASRWSLSVELKR